MATKFTFKKEARETGLASVGNPNPNTIIKLNKLEVGYIAGPNWQSKLWKRLQTKIANAAEDNLWRVRLMKKKEGGGWDWTQLAAKFEDEPAARAYLKENFARVCALGLHQEQPDD